MKNALAAKRYKLNICCPKASEILKNEIILGKARLTAVKSILTIADINANENNPKYFPIRSIQSPKNTLLKYVLTAHDANFTSFIIISCTQKSEDPTIFYLKDISTKQDGVINCLVENNFHN